MTLQKQSGEGWITEILVRSDKDKLIAWMLDGISCHGLGMRCGLGNIVHISELNSAIAFLSLKNAIALFSSEMS